MSALRLERLLISFRRHGYFPRTIDQVWEDVIRRTTFDPSGCWIHNGSPAGKKGYTRVYFNRRWIRTTHLSWDFHRGGLVPKGMMMCHKCDNPACYNPMHLFLGTNTDNMHDMIRKVGQGTPTEKDSGSIKSSQMQ